MREKTSRIPKQKLFIVLMLLVFLFSIFKIGTTFASTEPFELTEVSISNKSDTVVVNSINYEKTKITNDITFHKVGDSVTYKIKVVNNESDNYKIKSITDDNNNEYITYEYSNYEGTALNSKEETTFEITAKYSKEVTDMSKRVQSFSVKFTFTLEDSNGNAREENIVIEPTNTTTESGGSKTTTESNKTEQTAPVESNNSTSEITATHTNPKTGDTIGIYVTTSALSLIMLVIISRKNKVTVKSSKYNKNGKGKHSGNGIKFFSMFLVVALMLPTISKATNSSFEITIENTYKLYDKVLVTSYVDGVKTETIVTYNEVADELQNPVKENFTFAGWTLEDGTPFDITNPVTDDVTIIAKWEDARSDISISVTDENEWKPSKDVTITYNISNNDREIENQYSLDNGTTWNTYNGAITLNENNVTVKARTIVKDTNEVIGSTEKTVIKIDPTVPTIAISLGDRYYSGQELDLASVTTTTYGESGATVKWTIGDMELTNMSETNKIDRIDSQYEIQVVGTITTGAGLTATTTSQTIIIQYALWDNFLIDGIITRDNIQNMKFGSWAEKPTNPTGSKDISYNDTDVVFEYYTLDPETNLYDIYITSPYGYTRYYNDDMRIYIGDETNENMSRGLFSYMPNMKTIDFEYMDMYHITNTAHLFDMIDYTTYYWECNSSLTSITWGEKFNTTNIIDMSYMFAGLDKLETINLESFNLNSAKTLKAMFARDEKLETIEVSTWDTSNIEDIGIMFYATKSLQNLDVSKWNTSNVKDMSQMFYNCGISSLDLSRWNTSNVTNMCGMFEFVDTTCNFTSLDLSTWDVSNVTDMSYMFYRFAASDLNLSGWNTSNVNDMQYMFYSFTTDNLDLNSFDTTNVTNTKGMFYKANIKTIDFKNLNLPNVSDARNMFRQMTNIQNIYVKAMPTYKAGAQTGNMWTGSPISNYTIKEYDD